MSSRIGLKAVSFLLLALSCNVINQYKCKSSVEIISYSPAIRFSTILICDDFTREYSIQDYASVIKDSIIYDDTTVEKIAKQFYSGNNYLSYSDDIDVKVLVILEHNCSIDSFFIGLDQQIVICNKGYFKSNDLWNSIQKIRNAMHEDENNIVY